MEREAAETRARFESLCLKVFRVLENPVFFRALGMLTHPLEASPDLLRSEFRMDEQDCVTFRAGVQVVHSLTGLAIWLNDEDFQDARVWDRLISEFGMDELKVRTLQAYANLKPTSSSASEDHIAHLAFTDYKFQGEAHVHLYRQLQERRSWAHRAMHFSPYVALVQASGVGKSRAVMQMSSLGVYVCYCSLAGEFSTASPPRTGRLADKLASTFDEYEMVLYFKAWLRVLAQSFSEGNLTPGIWKEQQLPSKDGSPKGEIAERVYAEWESLLAHKGRGYKGKGDRDAVNIAICSTEVTAIKHHFSDSCRVIFVFDEARGLLVKDPRTKLMSESPFHQITRALRVFFPEAAFFAIFLDAAARVSNVLPTEGSETTVMMGVGLLTPIYCLPNMALHRPKPGRGAQQYWDPKNWLMYGRPLWAARWSSNPSVEKLVRFAVQKLLHTLQGCFDGVRVDVQKGIMAQSQAIALLSAAAGLSICATTMLSERLAASHMHLILRVTEEMKERRLYVHLSAEPILAEAAGLFLQHREVQEGALKHLEKAYLAGYVTPGPRGEFVTKFILVAVVWYLRKQGRILHPIPVKEYLGTLLHASKRVDKVLLTKVNKKCSSDGFVFFNSFVVIRRPPTIADLGRAFANGYALMYMAENRLPGADIVIPVWTSKGMTAIAISTKNVQTAGWLEEESVEKVKSEYTHVKVAEGLLAITIVMLLHEPSMKDGDNWVLWDHEDPFYIHLTCYGIDENYSFLGKDVKLLLKKLLVAVPDELSDATNGEKKVIMRMLPEQFDPPETTYNSIPFTERQPTHTASNTNTSHKKNKRVKQDCSK